MNKFYFTLLLSLTISVFAYGQRTTTVASSSREISGTFVLPDTSSNKSEVFNYRLTFDGTGKLTAQIFDADTTDKFDKEFSINQMNEEAFYASFTNIFASRPAIKKASIRDNAIKIYAKAEGIVQVTDDEPNTARLVLLKTHLPLELKFADKPTFKDAFFLTVEVQQVDIEFEDGTIKNLILRVKVPKSNSWDANEDGVLQFRNNNPIGISGKFSAERLRDNIMYAYDPCRVGELLKDHIPNYNIELNNLTLKSDDQPCVIGTASFNLAELIDFRPILESDKEDYSPANQVISLTPGAPSIMLKKEKRSKIFEVRSYTDLLGTNSKNPNGLIQIEAEKKIFLLEDKWPLINEYNYWGTMTYFEPSVQFSKLDNNNRNYLPDTSGSAANYATKHKKILGVNTLNLYWYKLRIVDMNLNLFNASFPQAKLNFLVDGRCGLYQTTIGDSLTVESGKLVKSHIETDNTVNTALYGFKLMCKFLPDSRFNLTLGYSLFRNEILNAGYYQNPGKVISTYSLEGYFKVSTSSTFFIRATYNQQDNNPNLNFVQAQLGVSLNIFKGNDSSDK